MKLRRAAATIALTATAALTVGAFAPTAVQAAVNYFDQTKTVTAGGWGKVSVSCPSGWKVTGGGGTSGYGSQLNVMAASAPTSNGWTVTFSNRNIYATVYAICVN